MKVWVPAPPSMAWDSLLVILTRAQLWLVTLPNATRTPLSLSYIWVSMVLVLGTTELIMAPTLLAQLCTHLQAIFLVLCAPMATTEWLLNGVTLVGTLFYRQTTRLNTRMAKGSAYIWRCSMVPSEWSHRPPSFMKNGLAPWQN